MTIKIPFIICLSNEEPKYSNLSLDRWALLWLTKPEEYVFSEGYTKHIENNENVVNQFLDESELRTSLLKKSNIEAKKLYASLLEEIND